VNDLGLWAVDAATFENIREAKLRAEKGLTKVWQAGPGESEGSMPYVVKPGTTPGSNIAVVGVRGLLYSGTPTFLDWFFGDRLRYCTLLETLKAAQRDSKIERTRLAVDSPGGDVVELWDFLSEVASLGKVKPIETYVVGACASAAYAIACITERIVGAPTSMAGSIGVRAEFIDRRGLDKQLGIERIVIANTQSPLKGKGVTDPEGRAAIQAQADEVGQWFIDHVAAHRGVTVDWVTSRMGGGISLPATAAREAKLIDEIATSPDLATLIPEASDDSEDEGKGDSPPPEATPPPAPAQARAQHERWFMEELEQLRAENAALKLAVDGLQKSQDELKAYVEEAQRKALSHESDNVVRKHINRKAISPAAAEKWHADAMKLGPATVDEMLTRIPDNAAGPAQIRGSDETPEPPAPKTSKRQQDPAVMARLERVKSIMADKNVTKARAYELLDAQEEAEKAQKAAAR